jgi:hypothetical protein
MGGIWESLELLMIPILQVFNDNNQHFGKGLENRDSKY